MAHSPYNLSLSRRQLLRHSARGAALGALVPVLGQAAGSDAGSVGSTCLNILYRNGPDVQFDYDWYRDNHLVHIMERYGRDAISRFELRKPLIDPAGPAPEYIAVVNIWINDPQAFAEAGAEHGQAIAAEVPMFTNTTLAVQNELLWGEAGADLYASEIGQRCMNIFYKHEEGARFDPDYYRDHHMPLIMDLYGTEAIRRFELRKPVPMEGAPTPAIMGSVHFYIEDQAAFDAAGQEHGPTLVADVPNFSSVQPGFVVSEVYGIDS